jgi:hypothetical protein
LPNGILRVLGEKMAKPDEGAFPNAIAIEDPSPCHLPEYPKRAVFRAAIS